MGQLRGVNMFRKRIVKLGISGKEKEFAAWRSSGGGIVDDRGKCHGCSLLLHIKAVMYLYLYYMVDMCSVRLCFVLLR